MKPAVVCAPLHVEQRALAGAGLPVVRTGAGPHRAAAAARGIAADGPDAGELGAGGLGARRIAADGPDARGLDVGLGAGNVRPVLVAGVAGALVDGMTPGDLVVADEIRADDRPPTRLASAPLLAAALRRAGHTVHVGPVHSTSRPVTGARRRTLAATGAIAADTESAWLVPAAAGGPVAVVRAVVDTPAAPLVRPGTITRGLAGLRALRSARPVLARWLAATAERTVTLAEPRSFCAGVERAIDTVGAALDRHGAPVYVRRHIVHNTHVVADLERRGAVFVDEVDQAPPGAVLVLAAHGVPPAVAHDARARARTVLDATCPLVSKVHAEVRRHGRAGSTVFLVGHRDHEEVEGTVGEAPDRVLVVESVDEAERVRPDDPDRVAYAVQTTLAVDEADQIAAVLRRRFPALAGPRTDDICYATTNRQRAVRVVAAESDLVLVAGSPTSSNSRRLAEVAARVGAGAALVDDPGDVDLDRLAGAVRVGLTAGASAPPHLVDELVDLLRGLGPVSVTTRSITTEDVRFTLPKEVS